MPLEAKPRSWWGSTYVVGEDGAPLTEATLSVMREGGRFTLDGQPYTLRRDRPARAYVLEDVGGAEVARAHRPSAFRRRFEVTYPGGALRVEQAGTMSGRYLVLDGEERVGEIRRRSFWSRQVEADLPAELPSPVRVFTLLIALLMYRRDESAATP